MLKILDTRTGKEFELSSKMIRVRHMQHRIKAWCARMDPFLKTVGKENRLVMLRLSYGNGDDYKPLDISKFMMIVRENLGENLLAYAWVAELHERGFEHYVTGALHYHVLLLVKRGTNIPKPDDAGWWLHGSTRIETARTPYYILTYTGKEYQKVGDYPKGVRVFAVWIREGLISKTSMLFFRLSSLPGWLVKDIWRDGAICYLNDGYFPKRQPGGGWHFVDQTYYSPWQAIDCPE